MIDRLLGASIPEPNSGCWLWIKALRDNGYGTIKTNGLSELAHRVSYRTFKAPIPPGLDLDHLCRTRACINPDHLEVVTGIENWWRGSSPSALAARRGRCLNGHPYTAANTAVVPLTGKRVCKTCRLEAGRRYEAKKIRQRRRA